MCEIIARLAATPKKSSAQFAHQVGVCHFHTIQLN